MSVNVNRISTENNWLQNMKVDNCQEKSALPLNEDNAVKISISQEGLESHQKKLYENNKQVGDGKVIEKKRAFVKQISNTVFVNHYESELEKEASRLKEQRESNSIYSLSNKTEDYVKAYANVYDEIVKGYQNGTRERYIEDKNVETGFRKMTMEEELSNLDKAFQKAADRETQLAQNARKAAAAFKKTAEKLSKYKGVNTSFANAYKRLEAEGKTTQENVGQKMVTLAQTWKDVYQVSGSKDSGIEKVLSLMNSLFHSNSKI